jgi:F0F1-type ATP synthase membrane subunit b/b'
MGRLMIVGFVFLAALVALIVTWRTFFKYVPPGYHLVVTSNFGKLLPPGHVVAEEGEQGVLREVMGEGWHFVMPITYLASVEPNTIIEPGKVGVLTALGGKPLPSGRFLAEAEDEQGIQRAVLSPGSYRINKHAFQVEMVPATEIKPGFVGVLRRRLTPTARPEDNAQSGLLPGILQPGLYFINPYELQVIPVAVGIFQSTFHYDEDPQRSTAITFTAKGGFPISLDCTIEWETRPSDMPSLLAEYGNSGMIEKNVIEVQANGIGRDLGIEYTAQDFITGTTREKFQTEFTTKLTDVCRRKNVVIHSAFIRNIVVPQAYLKPIRDKQVAVEAELTNKAKGATAEIEARVERAEKMVDQRIAEVQAETSRMIAGIERKVQNVGLNAQAEIGKLTAEYQANIAVIDAERTRLLGTAGAEVARLKDTAKASIHRMKLDVFQSDADAFLRYNLAQQLSPNLVVRLIHSGAGTFWTNLDGKGLNLLLPAGGAAPTTTGNSQK